MSESDSEEETICVATLSESEKQRVMEKINNLPTLEKLLAEKDPNAYTPEQLEMAVEFAREIIASQPSTEKEIEKKIRQLQKRYSTILKKSHLLAGYKKLLGLSDNPNEMKQFADHLHACPISKATAALTNTNNNNNNNNNINNNNNNNTNPASSDTTSIYSRFYLYEGYLVSKGPRSQSGILAVTIFTSAYPDGQTFSCKYNCYYCPNEPGQPRSYLLNEPGVRRANSLFFDPILQFNSRVMSLIAIGHPADKIEILILGGTWENYPIRYREEFIRDIFYAANIIFESPNTPKRPRLSLLQEQLLNETAFCKIIGLTLETRPDTINFESLISLRKFGCTRVQLGVQHTDDLILKKINRQATREDTMRAIKLLKDSAFKVDIHIMPDLPGSSPEADKIMFDDILFSPYLQADQWKIYPCQTTPFTVIEKWYQEGKYVPYGLEALIDVILYVKKKIHPFIRINRVIRDIPVDYVLAGVEKTNLRQLLADELKKQGTYCRCMRCREVKNDAQVKNKIKNAVLKERAYDGSEGKEIFLSFETEDERTLFGFLRLRLCIQNWETPFEELKGCVLIRELHVYGNLVTAYKDTKISSSTTMTDATDNINTDNKNNKNNNNNTNNNTNNNNNNTNNTNNNNDSNTIIAEGDENEEWDGQKGNKFKAEESINNAQHLGLGTRLLERAEEIARQSGYAKIAVISGIGVRSYYKKRGYRLVNVTQGGYLIKTLTSNEEETPGNVSLEAILNTPRARKLPFKPGDSILEDPNRTSNYSSQRSNPFRTLWHTAVDFWNSMKRPRGG